METKTALFRAVGTRVSVCKERISGIKEVKPSLRSLSLQVRLTFFLLIIGFSAGITASFFFAVESTKDLVDTFLDTETNPVSRYNNANQTHDWIFNFLGIDFQSNTASFTKMLKKDIPEIYRDSINYVFYFSPKGLNRWKVLGTTFRKFQNNDSIKQEILSNSTRIQEQRILEITTFHLFHLFSVHRIFLYISNPNDQYKYIVHTEIDSRNILFDTLKHKNVGLKLVLMVLFFSLLFGYFLAKHITTPIRIVSDRLEQLSKGNLNVRYETKREDDIGKMAAAMNEMAIATSYRIKTLHTMHKIDLEVTSSDSRSMLLKKITISIAEQFPDAFVDILEKTGGGYKSTIASPNPSTQQDTIVPLSLMPEDFIKNCHTFFRFTGKDLYFICSTVLRCSNAKEGISIPIMQQEQFKGILVVVMKRDITQKDINALTLIAAQISVALRSIAEVKERESIYFALVLALTNSVDVKSKWTAGHSSRVTEHALAIGRKLKFDKRTLETIRIAALLHDIGKLGIPEEILDKPEELTEEEYEVIKKHPEMGEQIISNIPNFEMVIRAVRNHHEHWDGKGYPDRLSKDTIPLIARIITVADVWDALTADRPYREGYLFHEAREIMQEERGKTFDPALLDIFLEIIQENS